MIKFLKMYKLIVNRLVVYYQILSVTRVPNKVEKNKSWLIDFADLHFFSLVRLLGIAMERRNKGYKVIAILPGISSRIFIQGWRSSPIILLDYIFFQILCWKLNMPIIWLSAIRSLKEQKLRADDADYDLFEDGVLRAESAINLESVRKYRLAMHERYFYSYRETVKKLCYDEAISVIICGHRTYYYRGLLYRYSGITNKGCYVGRRAAEFVVKKIHPLNYKNCCIDYGSVDNILPLDSSYLKGLQGGIMPWISNIKSNQEHFDKAKLSLDKGINLLVCNVWVDDNFKGEFNLFDNHFDAALKIIDWHVRHNIKLAIKLHPHNKEYKVEYGDKLILDKIRLNKSVLMDVSKYTFESLMPYTDVIISGGGSCVLEAAKQGKSTLCYCDNSFKNLGFSITPCLLSDFFDFIEAPSSGFVVTSYQYEKYIQINSSFWNISEFENFDLSWTKSGKENNVKPLLESLLNVGMHIEKTIGEKY
jgi:hypothetical protein